MVTASNLRDKIIHFQTIDHEIYLPNRPLVSDKRRDAPMGRLIIIAI